MIRNPWDTIRTRILLGLALLMVGLIVTAIAGAIRTRWRGPTRYDPKRPS